MRDGAAAVKDTSGGEEGGVGGRCQSGPSEGGGVCGPLRADYLSPMERRRTVAEKRRESTVHHHQLPCV